MTLNDIHKTPEQLHSEHSTKSMLEAMRRNEMAIKESTEARAADDSYTQELLEELNEKEFPKEIAVSMKGVSVLTLKGDKGDQGIQGIQGEKGEKGDKGDIGDSGQSIQGEKGEKGDRGIQGLKGDKGDKGGDGIDGKDGKDGKNGKDGSPDTPDEVVDKVNKAKKKIIPKQVEGLEKMMHSMEERDRHPVGGVVMAGGGGKNLRFRNSSAAVISEHVTELQFGSGLTPSYSSGKITLTAASSTPGGSDTQVQFNDGGSFGGDAGLTFNKTTNALTAGDVLVDDEVYDATNWNGSLEVPTKNAVRDKIEAMLASSGITRTIVVTSGSATMGSSASTDYVYLVAGAHTMTLPTAVSNTNRYTVKNNHSAAITVDTTSAQTIDGTTSISILPEHSVDIISNNSNWFII